VSAAISTALMANADKNTEKYPNILQHYPGK